MLRLSEILYNYIVVNGLQIIASTLTIHGQDAHATFRIDILAKPLAPLPGFRQKWV